MQLRTRLPGQVQRLPEGERGGREGGRKGGGEGGGEGGREGGREGGEGNTKLFTLEFASLFPLHVHDKLCHIQWKIPM